MGLAAAAVHGPAVHGPAKHGVVELAVELPVVLAMLLAEWPVKLAEPAAGLAELLAKRSVKLLAELLAKLSVKLLSELLAKRSVKLAERSIKFADRIHRLVPLWRLSPAVAPLSPF